MIGLDTETIEGRAVILSLEGYGSFRVQSWPEIIDILRCIPESEYCAFNLDYDVGAIVKYLSHRVKRLLFAGVRCHVGFVSMEYRAGKVWRLWVPVSGQGGTRLIVVYDCYQFYGTSLKRAAKRVLNKDKREYAVTNLTEADLLNPEFIQYADTDAELAGELMRELQNQLPQSLRTVAPLSPAFLSAKYFREPLRANLAPRWVSRIFRYAYHGGRFECLRRGYCGPVKVYDIRSAYPAEIAKLKTLEDAQYVWADTVDKRADYAAVNCTVDVTDHWLSPLQLLVGPGVSINPVGRYRLWLTKAEFDLCIARNWIRDIHTALNVYAQDRFPFRDMVLELYAGKKGPCGMAYKLILNSLYGKLCQRTKQWRRPNRVWESTEGMMQDQRGEWLVREPMDRFSNFLYASEITARVRLRMFDVADRFREQSVALFTDAVVSLGRLPLPLSDQLGDWDQTDHDFFYLVGSGVYLYRSSDGTMKAKFRGVRLPDAEGLWNQIKDGNGRTLAVPMQRRFSFRDIDRLSDYRNENLILPVVKRIDLNFDQKRIWLTRFGPSTKLQLHESIAVPILEPERKRGRR